MSGPISCLLNDYEVQFPGRGKSRLRDHQRTFLVLLVLDVFICFCVIGPAVISFWRATWEFWVHLLDFHGVPNYVGDVVSLAFGIISTFIIDIFHPNLNSAAGPVGSLSRSVFSKCFSLFWGISDIHLWKGVWDGVDDLFGEGLVQSGVTLLLGLVPLVISGSLKSALSMPIGISVDDPDSCISASTFLETTKKDPFYRRFGDAVISRILEVSVVLLWHGLWTMTDRITLDTLGWTYSQTTLFSFIIGSVGISLIFLIQLPLLIVQERMGKEGKRPVWWTIINILFTFVGVYITISSFRAVWYSVDIFFLPDHQFMTYVCSGPLGWFVLCSLGCSSCVHAGVFRDDPDLGITVPFYFLSQKFALSLDQEDVRTVQLEEQTKL